MVTTLLPAQNSIDRPPAILSLIGDTPLVEVTRIDTGPCHLFLKLENQNPTGSIKDRVALAMVEAAERAGQLAPRRTLIQHTAGDRRHDHRSDRGQHRAGTRPDRSGERLPHNSRYTGQDVAGKNRARPRPRRRGPADALRRNARPSGILSGCGGAARQRNSRRNLRESVWQSGQSAG